MELMTCRGCGAYVLAVRRAGSLEPLGDACPECGETSFENGVPEDV